MGATLRSRLSLVLIVAVVALSLVDLSNLSAAAPVLSKIHHWTPVQIGIALSAIQWAFVFQFFAGSWIDRWGPKIVLTLGLVMWSLVTGFTAVAWSLASLIAFRVLLGIGESPSFLAGFHVVKHEFKHATGLATGIAIVGVRIGIILGIPLAVTLIVLYGWQAMFMIEGAIGIVLALLWWLVYKPSSAASSVGDQIDSTPGTRIKWLSLFMNRSVVGASVGIFGAAYMNYIFTLWLPTYLVKAHHLAILKSGLASGLVLIGGLAGNLLGGWLADYLIKRGVSRSLARKSLIIGGLVCTAPMIMTVGLHSVGATLGLLAWSDFAVNVALANIWGVTVDISTPETVGSISGIQNGIAHMSGIVSPIVTGLALGLLHSFTVAFGIGILFTVLAIAAYLFIMGPVEELRLQPGIQPVSLEAKG